MLSPNRKHEQMHCVSEIDAKSVNQSLSVWRFGTGAHACARAWTFENWHACTANVRFALRVPV